MEYEITAIGGSERAMQVFEKAMRVTDKWLSNTYSNLDDLRDMTRNELTSTQSIDQIPLFAGLAGFAVAEASHSAGFAHGVTKNSGKGGPSGPTVA